MKLLVSGRFTLGLFALAASLCTAIVLNVVYMTIHVSYLFITAPKWQLNIIGWVITLLMTVVLWYFVLPLFRKAPLSPPK